MQELLPKLSSNFADYLRTQLLTESLEWTRKEKQEKTPYLIAQLKEQGMNVFLCQTEEAGFCNDKIFDFLNALICSNPIVFSDMMKDGAECKIIFDFFVLVCEHNPIDLWLSINPEEMLRDESKLRVLFREPGLMQYFLSKPSLGILSYFVNKRRCFYMSLGETPSKLQEKYSEYLLDFFIPIFLDEALRKRIPIAPYFSKKDKYLYGFLFDFIFSDSRDVTSKESDEKMTTILATREKVCKFKIEIKDDEINSTFIVETKESSERTVYFNGEQSEIAFFSASPKSVSAAKLEKAEMSDEEKMPSKASAGKSSREYTLHLMSSLPDEVKVLELEKEEKIYISPHIPSYKQLKHSIYIDPDTREYMVISPTRQIEKGILPENISLDDATSRLNHEDLKKTILKHLEKQGHIPTKTQKFYRYFNSSSADAKAQKPTNAHFISSWFPGIRLTVGRTKPGGPS